MKIKQNKSKILKFFLIAILYILSIVGMVFGSINIGENNTQRGYYGDSYVASYAVRLDNTLTTEEKEAELQTAADKFSNWLIYRNIINNGVQYELTDETVTLNSYAGNISTPVTYNVGYLYVTLTSVDQVTDPLDSDETVNKAAEYAALEAVNTSRIDVFQYDPNAAIVNTNQNTNTNYTSGNYVYSRVITSDSMDLAGSFIDPRDEDDGYNTNGVEVNTNTLMTISRFNTDKVNSAGDSDKVQWLVIQNLDVLLARLNYAKYVMYQYTYMLPSLSDEQEEKIVFAYETMDSTLQTWASSAISSTSSGTTVTNDDIITENNLIYYYFQAQAGSSTDPNANSNLTSIVDNYILGTIDYNNYNNWFPDAAIIGETSSDDDSSTTTNTTSGTSQVSSISFQPENGTTSERDDFLYQFHNTVVPLRMFPNILNAEGLQSSTYYNEAIGTAWIQQPYLANSVTTLSSYEATFLASGVILLLIAIIVSLLYRVPGVFGAFSIISTFVLSASLLVLLNINFSLPAVLGLFVGLLISIASISVFMERVRRYFAQRNSVFDSLQTGLKKTMMTIVDFNVSAILFGLAMFFLGANEIVDFGLVLILVPIVTLVSLFLFFIFPVYTISTVNGMWMPQRNIWQIKKPVKYKINFNPKKWNWVWLVVGVLSLLTIILMATIGAPNSTIFNSGSTVYLQYYDSSLVDQIISSLTGLSGNWTNITYGANDMNQLVLTASTTVTYSIADVTSQLQSLIDAGSVTLVGVSNSTSSFWLSVSASGIYSLLLAFAMLSVYYMLRLNFFSILPMFLTNIFSVFVSVFICYLTYMYIDVFFVYAMIFSSVISNMVACMYISVTKTRFEKRKVFSEQQVQVFITNNLKSMLNVVFLLLFSNLLMSIILAILMSPTTVWLFVYLIIGTSFGISFSYFMISHLYYYSILIRQKYVRNVVHSIDRIIAADQQEVDEQLILSINKFE